MTHDVYKRDGNKISQITSPILRYVLRLLSMTIFCQGEPSGVSKFELGCLYSLMPEAAAGTPNWVDIFVRKCLDIQKAKKGKIGMGGMVALLAQAVRVPILHTYRQVDSEASPYYDLDTLRRTNLIKLHKHNFRSHSYLVVKGVRGMPLPAYPGHFDIGEHTRVADMFVHPPGAAGAQQQAAPMEEEPEQQQEEEAEEEEPPQPPRSSTFEEDTWRATMLSRMDHFDQRLDTLDHQVTSFADQFDGDMYDLQSRMSAMWSYQRASFDMYASMAGQSLGPGFVDPRPEIDEMERQRAAEREQFLASRRASRSRRERRDHGQSSRD